MVVLLSDTEMLELCRILIDRDEAGALAFPERQLRAKVRRASGGG